MGATDFHDPYDILPKSFKDRYADCDTVDVALRKAENSPGTTPNDTKVRCQNCRSVRLRSKRFKAKMPHRLDPPQKCTGCGEHVDEPRAPLAECPVEYGWKWLDEQQRYRESYNKTLPMNTPFTWIDDSTDLEDPDERGFSPPFAGLDDETRVELAIRLYKPWTDDGPSYRELAALFPHGRAWIGERVREWKAGEHRELVEQPGPTVDAARGDAIAADGGTPRSRWAAYGSD